MNALEVTGLRLGYRAADVLRGVDIDVQPSELFAVLGPSGCGKTTLLRAIAGFERPRAGTITLMGTVVSGPDVFVQPEKRRVTIVPQEAALFPHLTVRDNVGFGLQRGANRKQRIRELIDMVGLGQYEDRYPSQLSGGEQQRVALARALAPNPTMVLLDEPFSALDAALRFQLREEVRGLLRAAGTTAVLVTHDQDEALSLASRVAVMREGRVVQIATPDELYRHPIDIEVASFVGTTVVLDGVVCGDRVTCALGEFAARGSADGIVRVVFRPEQLRLGVDGVAAQVADLSFHGHDALVHIWIDGSVPLCARVTGTEAPAPGSSVRVRVVGEPLVYPR